jgi:Protein of unknown function (DUF4019)
VRLLIFALACLSITGQDLGAARKAAEKWLPLIDAGKYTESRDRAAASFRKSVTAEQWNNTLAEWHKLLGKFKSRSFDAGQQVTNPPDHPPGDYCILQFVSNFENKNGAMETVVMVREKRGSWRMAGYFCK